ncbi:LysR family transcriptional regulator [Nocardiopsis valliformis]|uniref:LysR family transcriptional regulator n=1 Tax=Nocardiopsis valliformis TaxID=239974 RepID=UPI0004768188|nr:LysR family transcriptional regulator [Nocardiopsis valliformis]
MENRHLASFVSVVRQQSFTRAATDLSYSQSTVTGHVQALEKSLGVTLFDRLPGRIRLTDAGKKLFPYAVNLIELASEAREAVRDEVPSGRLSVGSMESITAYRLLPLIEHMHLRFPQIDLTLRPSLCAETVEALRGGTYDCGFVIAELDHFPGLGHEVLCAEPLSLVAAPDHRLADTSDIAVEELRRERVIGTEPGCAYRDLFQGVLSGTGTGEPFPVLELGNTDVIKRGVGSGLGVALLPTVTVAEELRAKNLVALDWKAPFQVHTQLLWRDTRQDTVLRTFITTAARLMHE